MAAPHLAGSRIRERRLDRGLRQAAVAETVGISASYLNLIEHNRRRIGGKILADIARVLDVEPALLTAGADTELLDQLRAAVGHLDTKVELGKAEELAARYPGWSNLIAAQAQRITALQEQVNAWRDRMTHDPALADALHEVISAVSAIRATAAILVSPEEIDADWRNRFHQNIHKDSLRLASSSEALVSYLEAPDVETDEIGTPLEQVENWLAQTAFHVVALERAGANPDKIAAKADLPEPVRELLATHLRQYASDAALLPLDRLVSLAQDTGYDPAVMAQSAGVAFDVVLRRLASLPPGEGHPPIGMAVSDASGALCLHKPVAGFALQRFGGACPLWPLYGAMARPGQPVRQDVCLADADGTRLRCFAMATTVPATAFDALPIARSTMIVLPDPAADGSAVQLVGTSCRICPRHACTSRREPAIAGVLL